MLTLTRKQFDALSTLVQHQPGYADVKEVRIDTDDDLPGEILITFDAGYGTSSWYVDANGAHYGAGFGVSVERAR